MGYQSKTYSYSDEVVEAIEAQKALGISPDRYLWSLIFGEQKPSKRVLVVEYPPMAEGQCHWESHGKIVGSTADCKHATGSQTGKAGREKGSKR